MPRTFPKPPPILSPSGAKAKFDNNGSLTASDRAPFAGAAPIDRGRDELNECTARVGRAPCRGGGFARAAFQDEQRNRQSARGSDTRSGAQGAQRRTRQRGSELQSSPGDTSTRGEHAHRDPTTSNPTSDKQSETPIVTCVLPRGAAAPENTY